MHILIGLCKKQNLYGKDYMYIHRIHLKKGAPVYK